MIPILLEKDYGDNDYGKQEGEDLAVMACLQAHQNFPAFDFQIAERLHTDKSLTTILQNLVSAGYLEMVPTYRLTPKTIGNK